MYGRIYVTIDLKGSFFMLRLFFLFAGTAVRVRQARHAGQGLRDPAGVEDGPDDGLRRVHFSHARGEVAVVLYFLTKNPAELACATLKGGAQGLVAHRDNAIRYNAICYCAFSTNCQSISHIPHRADLQHIQRAISCCTCCSRPDMLIGHYLMLYCCTCRSPKYRARSTKLCIILYII